MRHRRYYRSGNRNISPLTMLVVVLFALAAFFLALPIFLAALLVFAVVGGYLAWRVHRVMYRVERDHVRYRDVGPDPNASSLTIDVTPGHDEWERR